MAVGATSNAITNTNITQCTSLLNTNESLGDKGTVLCECAGSTPLGSAVDVSAFDIAQIQCVGTTGFTVQKTCVPVTGASGSFTSTVTVTNTGTNSITCSTPTDQWVSGTCGTSPTCPIAGGNPVTMSSFVSLVSTGTLSGITSTACNEACVTCTPSGVTCTGAGAGNCPTVSGLNVACVSGACQYTPATAAEATCPVGFCFTRTPGYWGTHPDVTQSLLPQTVCGQLLTTTTAALLGSATENLCESGQDAKTGKGNSFYTSPQQLQLIRQCTAAALNLAASGKDGGISAGLLACEGADPGITTTFNNCCVGPTSTCDSGKSGSAIGASNCIDLLGAFNALESGDFSQVGLTNSPALPAQCQAATGNGLTNCSSDGLGGTINCGSK